MGQTKVNPKQMQRQSPRVNSVVKGNNTFAWDLYARLKGQEGNLFFSPYSLSSALSMTYAGAGGETRYQMAEILHVPAPSKTERYDLAGKLEKIKYAFIPPVQWHTPFGALIKQLNDQGQKGDYQLSIANALWGQQGYGFLQEYLDLTQKYYGAGLKEVDFVNDAERENTRRTINAWVEDQTNKKIKDLIKPGALNALTRLVLTNAIYFKGDWALQFEKKNTKDAPFYIAPDEKIDVPMMHQKSRFNYASADDLQILELPYKGEDLSMVVLLPKRVDGLEALEKSLTAENLDQWLKDIRRREVLVYLPRFKQTCEFGLADVLKKMGMPDAFEPGKADFSGINGKNDLFISAVVHKAFVEVNEEGTEAAAATGIIVGVTAIPTPPPVFRADHPFVFMIRDVKTGAILFLGRVAHPQ
ncbi:MAG: hypothetical protein AMJ79_06075 [Phycisphaerae bacterium SM23_30]|nr:MAG: hypothetical protein AMJ79_06075 [Phycisphaerae bacterium SM23_30]